SAHRNGSDWNGGAAPNCSRPRTSELEATAEGLGGQTMVDEAVNHKQTLLVQEDLAMINLFRVTNIVKEYSGHRNVKFEWLVEKRKEPPVPYAKAIRDYDPTTIARVMRSSR